MTIQIRKTVSAGPFKFRFSPSGIGMSVGVKGLRFGVGPKGNYAYLSLRGHRYRMSLDQAGHKPKKDVDASHSPGSIRDENVVLSKTSNINVMNMQDVQFKHILDQINGKLEQWQWAHILSGICASMAALFYFVGMSSVSLAILFLTIPAFFLGAHIDSYKRAVVLFYDFDPDIKSSYEKAVSAFKKIAASKGAWQIKLSGKVKDLKTWKRNAGADNLIDRDDIVLGISLPNVIKCNIDVPSIYLNSKELYFFPDFLLVFRGGKAGAVPYQEFQIQVEPEAFIETEKVPPDAKVIRYTWQHPNKDGGPDRRFANNKKIPVCQYDSLLITSNSGLKVLIQISATGTGDLFSEAISRMASTASPPSKNTT